jgi:ABC-type transport system substrate-binding protein
MDSPVTAAVNRRQYLQKAGSATLLGTTVGCLGGTDGSTSADGNGVWYTPSGDRLTIEVKAPSNGTWPLNAQTTVDTLTGFGIESQAVLREKAAYGEDYRTGSFTLAVHNWGIFSQNRYPFTFFSREFGSDRGKIGNFDPTAMRVPYPVGDPGGSLETVNVEEKIQRLGRASDDEQSDLVRELAWIYNQTLPRLPLMVGISRTWLTEDDWTIPERSNQLMRENGLTHVLLTGNVNSKAGSDDNTFSVPTRRSNPNDMQWNPYFVQAGMATPASLMFEPLVATGVMPSDIDVDVPSITPILAESVTKNDGKLQVTIKDDRTWSDGDPVNADDVATQFRLEDYLGLQAGELWDTLTRVDDLTVEFEIGDRNPNLAKRSIARKAIRTKRDSRFASWLTRLEEATTDKERESIRQEVTKTRIEDIDTYGLWQIERRSQNSVLMTVYEDHPRSNAVEYDLEMPAIPNNQKRWQSMQNDRIDGLFKSTGPKSIEDRFPDHTVRLSYPQAHGDALVFNHDKPPFDDRAVRKAIAFLVNRWTNSHNAKDFVTTVRWPTALPNAEAERYLGDALDQYQEYGYKETKKQAAAQVLREAGYRRE